jgi:DNA (cytosine-5)-methyltransferase 1
MYTLDLVSMHGVAHEPMLLDGTRVDDVRVYTEPTQTLTQRMGTGGNNVPMIAQDVVGSLQARDYKGVGNQYVAENKLVVQEPILSFDTQFGSNANVFEDQTPTLKASQQSPSVAMPGEVQAVSYDGYNQKVEEEIHRAWRIGIDSGDFVADLREVPLVVRRLTPLECERLMGWPDFHTAIGANGDISDTQRYRMCGNGVASPVAEWVAKQLVRLDP